MRIRYTWGDVRLTIGWLCTHGRGVERSACMVPDWDAELSGIVRILCGNGQEHEHQLTATLSDYTAVRDPHLLNDFEGAIRQQTESAKRLIRVMIEYELETRWFDPCDRRPDGQEGVAGGQSVPDVLWPDGG